LLKDFGNLGVMKMNPPVRIKDLALLGQHIQIKGTEKILIDHSLPAYGTI
jgi:hypothetical protein